MSIRVRLAGLLAVLSLSAGADLLACGDKFLVAGRGTRYQRPKNARAASVLIYADPALPATLGKLKIESVLKREGHRATTVGTLDQLAAMLASGRFDVILAAGTVAAAVERLLAGEDAPVLVSLCAKAPADAGQTAPCAVKAPPKERSVLEAIDRAVLERDRNARKSRG